MLATSLPAQTVNLFEFSATVPPFTFPISQADPLYRNTFYQAQVLPSDSFRPLRGDRLFWDVFFVEPSSGRWFRVLRDSTGLVLTPNAEGDLILVSVAINGQTGLPGPFVFKTWFTGEVR